MRVCRERRLPAKRLTEHRAEVEVTVDARPRAFGEAGPGRGGVHRGLQRVPAGVRGGVKGWDETREAAGEDRRAHRFGSGCLPGEGRPLRDGRA
ncbi:hypothetical protein SBD_5096 [Streptomyces bottropensis ATCC 25435]|uniref:Uncharacterized protein n=1 Tax=Streptomyces bottropensis ATCC 25435 TaxID=1054862 RepID=M3DB39_9ACTN|nr:hypothetical protein SBD_5096 [Streptomyces bottropensis ATCC 25435]